MIFFFQSAHHLIDRSFINCARENISKSARDKPYYSKQAFSDHTGTTHVSVMDEDGLAVSATSTINELWEESLFDICVSTAAGRYITGNDTKLLHSFLAFFWRFGGAIYSPQTGIILNNELTDFCGRADTVGAGKGTDMNGAFWPEPIALKTLLSVVVSVVSG